MRYQFELYILAEQLTDIHLTKLFNTLSTYLGVLSTYEVHFICSDNVIRIVIGCDKDLSTLSNTLEGVVLRPITYEPPVITGAKTERNLQYVVGGNLLDLKEKYMVKKSKDLQYVFFKVKLLTKKKPFVQVNFYLKDLNGEWSKSHKVMWFMPIHLFQIDFAMNTRYIKKSTPKYLDIEKSLHMMVSENLNALFEVETFPYLPKDYYLNLTSYDFNKHSMIVGASGSGKSKLINLIVDRLSRTAMKVNYRVVIVDPHASIANDFKGVPDTKIISFGMDDGADLFPQAGADLSAATELTATLFKSVLGDQFNARLDKLLRYALFVLMTAQTMSLENLKRFLTETDYRIRVLEHVHDFVPANIVKFFGADYNEIRTQYYETTVLPLVSMVDEMQLQPSLVGENANSLSKTIQNNYLTIFSLNKISMGEKVVKTVSGLLIQQIFLLAQARMLNENIILVIDEVSVVQNPGIAQILAEARKFNLSVVLTQQYFGQVDKDLRDAIFANVFNYYTFKVSEEDAKTLEGNLNIDFPKEVIDSAHEKGIGLTQLRVQLMTELHPRECLVRVVSNGQIAPCIKARTVDAPATVKVHEVDFVQTPARPMPEKFVEYDDKSQMEEIGSNGQRSVQFSKEFLEMLARSQSTSQQSQPPPNFVDVKSLLASQSSSRDNVKDKEIQ